MIAIAREKRISAFVGDGLHRETGVHLLDTASLYRPLRDIAEAISRRLNVPVVAKSYSEMSRP